MSRTIVIPDDWGADDEATGPLWFFAGDDEERDVSKPVAYDEQGRPLYAPRGIRRRWPE